MTAARAGRGRRWRRLTNTAITGLLVLGIGAAGTWIAWEEETTAVKVQAEAPPIRLEVPSGATAESIGRELAALGLTRHPAVFQVLARTRGVSGLMKAGAYSLRGPLSLEGILDMLVHGDVVHHAITIPEGRTVAEIAKIVEAQGLDAEAFLDEASDPTPLGDLDPEADDLEGYLFPDTYDLAQTPEAPRLLVHRMTQRFREVITPQLARIAESGLSLRQVVILASIVELETGLPEERPQIAAVFLNRLRKGMLLQTDPSIIYALKKAGRWDGNIRRQDLAMDSPYNTYRTAGLPPGPLGCPGREAIEAVLDPASTRALYFVSRNDGSHQFSATLAEHNRAVDRYQRHRARS